MSQALKLKDGAVIYYVPIEDEDMDGIEMRVAELHTPEWDHWATRATRAASAEMEAFAAEYREDHRAK